MTKIPRWAFEKFPEANAVLTTQMKSVGEVMAIGRTFRESFQKALRGLEVGRFGLGCDKKDLWGTDRQPTVEEIKSKLATPNTDRVWHIRYAMLAGMPMAQIQSLTNIDPWFLDNLQALVALEGRLREAGSLEAAGTALIREAKRNGFSDPQLAHLWGLTEMEGSVAARQRRGVSAVFQAFRRHLRGVSSRRWTPYYNTRPTRTRTSAASATSPAS